MQREDVLSLTGTGGDAIGDRVPDERMDRDLLARVEALTVDERRRPTGPGFDANLIARQLFTRARPHKPAALIVAASESAMRMSLRRAPQT